MSRGHRSLLTAPRAGRWVAACFVTLLALAGCASSSRQESRPSPQPSAAAVAQASAGGTLNVSMVTPAYQGFDPHASYDTAQWEVLRCCLQRTLMTYPGLVGYPGTQPVPDLAVDYPAESADGLTWTWQLRRGVHYAPPYQDLEVTAQDVIRGIQRTASSAVPGEPGAYNFGPLIEGYQSYADGKAASISGLVAPDPYTLQVRLLRPDGSVLHQFASPWSAPIPPLPSQPDAPLGTATGHDFALRSGPDKFVNGPARPGYGPFQVATGPYLIDGAAAVLDKPSGDPWAFPAGFTPSWSAGQRGSLALVRNPSWDPTSDPIRAALPDRIEITIQPSSDPYQDLLVGSSDVVIGENPTQRQLSRYAADSLRDRVHRTVGSGVFWLVFNPTVAPFDDIHVRRAVALAVNRTALRAALLKQPDLGAVAVGPLAAHLVQDSLIGNMLAAWQPFPGVPVTGSVQLARRELAKSPYYRNGRCTAAACRDVPIGSLAPFPAPIFRLLTDVLRSLGMDVGARVGPEPYCGNVTAQVGLCQAGWATDFPDASNMFLPFAGDQPGAGFSFTPRQLSQLGLNANQVPSVASDIERCSNALTVQGAGCWARIDQWLTQKIVAAIPIAAYNCARLAGQRVSSYSLDQAYCEPSLDQIAVAP